MMTLNHLMVGLALLISSVASLVVGSVDAKADGMIEIIPVGVSTGVQLNVGQAAPSGQCPCFRWTVQVHAGGGRIETREVLISSEALFRYYQTADADFSEVGTRLFSMGAIEALFKGAHIGVGFNGVTLGTDPDHGFENVLRTGFYALFNLIRTAAVRFDIRSGYDFERLRTLSSEQVDRDILTQRAVMQFNSFSWSGAVSAFVGLDAHNPFSAQYMRFGAAANVRSRLVSFSRFELGLGASVSVEQDYFRELLGLNPTNFTGMLFMDLSYVERVRN